MDDNPIEKLSGIIELYETALFMNDPKVTKGLVKLASILAKPEVNPMHIARHVVECEALAADYAIKAKYYMTIGKDKPDARDKKNIYMTLKDQFHELAASLKYVVRAQT